MLCTDGISLDDNLISGYADGINDENIANSNHSKAAKRAKRRRHALLKLNGRLDRKSSRGMIYENEELRLRTININAEVERGQSDIKRLRRENEHLRREIWSLRDECDRLNKRFKAKLAESLHDHGGCMARTSGGSGGGGIGCQGRRGSCNAAHSNSNSGDSDSCDTCKGDNDDTYIDDYKYSPSKCCVDGTCKFPPSKLYQQQQQQQQQQDMLEGPQKMHSSKLPIAKGDDNHLHATFDHLSVVSEETLSNSEVLASGINANNLPRYSPPELSSPQSALPSFVRPLTPLTPVEMVANELNDLQSVMPPLSYFENVLHQHMDATAETTPETVQTTNSGKTVIQTNGWDYNLRSPFTQHPYPSNPSPLLGAVRTEVPTLTTFAPAIASSPEFVEKSDAEPTAEIVAITTSSVQGSPKTANSPKHFFAPLKPRLRINTALANRHAAGVHIPQPPVVPQNYEPPDIYVANALPTPYRPHDEVASPDGSAALASAHPEEHGSQQTTSQHSQSDSANLEAILNDIETISEDILAIQLEKNKSRENLNKASSTTSVASSAPTQKAIEGSQRNKKPYRSEMNLRLIYDGTNPKISPTTSSNAEIINTLEQSQATNDNNNQTFRTRTRSLEREHTDSPSPNVPDPMTPFPNNRTYIGFDQLNAASATVMGSPTSQTANESSEFRKEMPAKAKPPTPPTRNSPSAIIHQSGGQGLSPQQKQRQDLSIAGTALNPNKSHIYAALAHAAVAKRAQFRAQPSFLTKSLETDLMPDILTEPESPAGEAGRRKTRRVSIVCADFTKEDETVEVETPDLPTPSGVINAGSYHDLQAPNPIIMHLKQTSHSTPNSPHSMRRGSISVADGAMVNTHRASTHSSGSRRGNSFSTHHRKCSQDSIRAVSTATTDLAAVVAEAAATVRSKCSRRNSESTVVSGLHRLNSTSGRHYRQHSHRHYTHQHTPSSVTANPHHSHHLRQESNNETGTSISDRNSNSFVSSGESSASLSLRSQRRKLSVGSHGGGKIPWCGCWGNGCI